MKIKVSIFITLLLSVMLLSACSADRVDSSTDGSTGGSSHNDTVTVSLNESGSSTSSNSGETSASDAFESVLLNGGNFINTVNSREVSLKDFLNGGTEYAGAYQVTHFTLVDMDRDNIPEVILELSINDSSEQYEMLHYKDGSVYGYNFVHRGLEMLKADGTYTYASSAADVGVQRITNFTQDAVETETLGYAQSDYSDSESETEIFYFIRNVAVTKEEFDVFYNEQQDQKKDAQWYDFSTENLETKISSAFEN